MELNDNTRSVVSYAKHDSQLIAEHMSDVVPDVMALTFLSQFQCVIKLNNKLHVACHCALYGTEQSPVVHYADTNTYQPSA